MDVPFLAVVRHVLIAVKRQLFEKCERPLKGPFILYSKEQLFTVLLMESRNMTVPASLKWISSGRQWLGNLTSILMKVLPRIFFILLLTVLLFPSNSLRCREERNFPLETISVKKLSGCRGAKSLILWKRLVRQSMTVDGSAPLERSLPPKKRQRCPGCIAPFWRLCLGRAGRLSFHQHRTTLLQMAWQSLQNKMLASRMRIRRWRLSSLI